MENIAWMAWTAPTAIFFCLLAGTLAVMTWLAVRYPEAERVGILRIPTTRGDRLFISLIAAAVLFSARFEVPVKALAWGVLAAGVLQFAVQVPALVKLGLLPRPRWGWRHSGVRKILKLMIPTLFGSSVAQVNLLVDSVVATFLVSGSVTWLYYSDRLLEFPLGVFGVALSTVILPNLSRKFAQQSSEAFSATLDWALRLAMIITIPSALGLVVLALVTGAWLVQAPIADGSGGSCGSLLHRKATIWMDGSRHIRCQGAYDGVLLRQYEVGASALSAVWVLAVGVGVRRRNITLMRLHQSAAFAT